MRKKASYFLRWKRGGSHTEMSKIIPKERVKAALNFEETDIVPYDLPIDILILPSRCNLGVNFKAGEDR
jgi:hypothetical protein